MILAFDDSAKCAVLGSVLSNPAKRRILEIVSRGPLALDVLAALTGTSGLLLRDVISEMEGFGLLKTQELESGGVKKIFVKTLTPLFYEGDIQGLEEVIEEASRRMLESFMEVIDKKSDVIERAFDENEGKYALSSLLAYCFGVAYKKACEELRDLQEAEYQDLMRKWIDEVDRSKSQKGKKD